MKLLALPSTITLISDHNLSATLKTVLKEAFKYGFGTIESEKNPFWHRSNVVIWWDDSSPLAIYHKKNDENHGNFALLFEKPFGVPLSEISKIPDFFETILIDAVEVNLV